MVDSYPEDPTLERSFRGHKNSVTSLVFNPNMKQLISGSLDNCLMVWNFKPQLRAYRFTGHKAPVTSVDYNSTAGLIASGSKDRTVRLWLPTVEGKSTVIKVCAKVTNACPHARARAHEHEHAHTPVSPSLPTPLHPHLRPSSWCTSRRVFVVIGALGDGSHG